MVYVNDSDIYYAGGYYLVWNCIHTKTPIGRSWSEFFEISSLLTPAVIIVLYFPRNVDFIVFCVISIWHLVFGWKIPTRKQVWKNQYVCPFQRNFRKK